MGTFTPQPLSVCTKFLAHFFTAKTLVTERVFFSNQLSRLLDGSITIVNKSLASSLK